MVDTITVSSSKVGWNELTIKLNDYPIQFDDQYHLSFLVKEEIKVLVVYSKLLSEELMNYIKAIPYFKVSTQELSKLDYGKFKEFQLIILANLPQVSSGLGTELRKGLEEGVNLVVFPAPDLGNMSYKELNTAISFPTIISFDRNQREASRINTEADIFQDVFSNPNANIKLPITKGHYTFSPNKSIESILANRDQSLLLFRYNIGQAMVYVCSSPFLSEYNDLTKSPEILLPFLFKASISGSKNSKFSYTIGKDPIIEWNTISNLSQEDMRLTMKGPEEFIPSIRTSQNKTIIEIFDQVSKAGNYQLLKNNEEIGKISFNEDRIESDLRLTSLQDIKEKYGKYFSIIESAENTDFTNLLQATMQKSQWWRYLLWGALLFLLIEALLIRYLKSK